MKSNRMKHSIILIFLVSLNLSAFVVIAQDVIATYSSPIDDDHGFMPNVHYSKWNETIVVGMDGSLLITEEMTFYLTSGSYGYAYRNLAWNNFHDLNSWSIESANDAVSPSLTYHIANKESDYIEFYWEWTRTYISVATEYTFILTYNVSSAMILNGNRDRVYWNVIGGEFDYTIYDISTKVIFPKEYAVNEINSTTYYQGKDPGDDEGFAYLLILTLHQRVLICPFHGGYI
ncbi:MAG: DUF2207 domain-containing protein [Candidatus Heimdallarchaeota archaeon]